MNKEIKELEKKLKELITYLNKKGFNTTDQSIEELYIKIKTLNDKENIVIGSE